MMGSELIWDIPKFLRTSITKRSYKMGIIDQSWYPIDFKLNPSYILF